MADIEKFDPATLVDKVRERVRNTIAELIPEEQWKAMIAREVEAFVSPSKDRNGYERNSAIRDLVISELNASLKAMFTTEFASTKWSPWWNEHGQNVGTNIEKLIIDNAPALLAGMLKQGVQMIVQQMGYNVK